MAQQERTCGLVVVVVVVVRCTFEGGRPFADPLQVVSGPARNADAASSTLWFCVQTADAVLCCVGGWLGGDGEVDGGEVWLR